MLRRRYVPLMCLAVMFLASSANAQQSARRIGIGVAIGDITGIAAVTALGTTEDTAAAPSIFVPVQITSRFRVEPEISLFRHSHEEPFEYKVNAVEVGIGLFPQRLTESYRLYYGVRVGYVRVKEEEPRRIAGLATRTQTIDGFFAAPAIGGEYLLSDRFGLGAEAQIRHTAVSGDDDGDSVKTSATATRVLFTTRFYF